MNNVLTFGETNNILNAPIILACMRKYELLIDDIIKKHGFKQISAEFRLKPNYECNMIEITFTVPDWFPDHNKIRLIFEFTILPNQIPENGLEILFDHFWLSTIEFYEFVPGETFNLIRKYLEKYTPKYGNVYLNFSSSERFNNTILGDLKNPIRFNKNKLGMDYAKIPGNYFNSPPFGYIIDENASIVLKSAYDQYESRMSHIMFTIWFLRAHFNKELSRVIMGYLY